MTTSAAGTGYRTDGTRGVGLRCPGPDRLPGFDADVLWKFRWYSLINQLLIWTVTGLVFGALLERYLNPPQPKAKTEPAEREPALS